MEQLKVTAVPKLEVGGRDGWMDGWMDEKKTLPSVCNSCLQNFVSYIFNKTFKGVQWGNHLFVELLIISDVIFLK